MDKSKRLNEFSPKDRNLIKGNLRRSFARSDQYKAVFHQYRIEHEDLINHPRCRNWAWCSICGQILPAHTIVLDHISPVIELDKELGDYTVAELVERIWCDPSNLQSACKKLCHAGKSLTENRARREFKKLRKKAAA